MVVEKFIGANNLQFEIVECNDTHIPDIKEFCSKVDIENNSTLKSIKFGKWGALEKWWAVYHKNKIISLSGSHYLPHINKNCYVIAYRLATLEEFKGMASDKVSSRMLNDFGMGKILPYQVNWCLDKGAETIVATFNSSANDKAYRVAHKVLPRDNKFTLMYKDFQLYDSKQDVWKLNYKDFNTMEQI